ncbi:immunity 26/phosphotriesterase HocA family protein [Serratia marcescens]|uniref:immunity 26/phosphotriesterase HocA family protein n=1 Tax=Serratia marcescens TaxID=615 RepID=UPI0020A2CA83|nr:immunity 26/phosphotriesterase HocA family protein [Serratia marcescens]
MGEFKCWGWDKKPRTMLRFIKPGDVFCFKLTDEKYGFGRIISKVSIGHSAEIFDVFSKEPEVPDDLLSNPHASSHPIILDAYSLFDKKISGEWRIIGHQEGWQVKKFENTYFVYGALGNRKKVDMYGNSEGVSDRDSEHYPPYMPSNDMHVRNLLAT